MKVKDFEAAWLRKGENALDTMTISTINREAPLLAEPGAPGQSL